MRPGAFPPHKNKKSYLLKHNVDYATTATTSPARMMTTTTMTTMTATATTTTTMTATITIATTMRTRTRMTTATMIMTITMTTKAAKATATFEGGKRKGKRTKGRETTYLTWFGVFCVWCMLGIVGLL